MRAQKEVQAPEGAKAYPWDNPKASADKWTRDAMRNWFKREYELADNFEASALIEQLADVCYAIAEKRRAGKFGDSRASALRNEHRAIIRMLQGFLSLPAVDDDGGTGAKAREKFLKGDK